MGKGGLRVQEEALALGAAAMLLLFMDTVLGSYSARPGEEPWKRSKRQVARDYTRDVGPNCKRESEKRRCYQRTDNGRVTEVWRTVSGGPGTGLPETLRGEPWRPETRSENHRVVREPVRRPIGTGPGRGAGPAAAPVAAVFTAPPAPPCGSLHAPSTSRPQSGAPSRSSSSIPRRHRDCACDSSDSVFAFAGTSPVCTAPEAVS